MKACLLYGPRKLQIENIPEPVLQKDYALIKVKQVGICGTDIAMYTGKYRLRKIPLIPGHEVVGVVEDVLSHEHRDLIGKKVVFEINIVCWECEFCKRGLYTHCVNRKAIGIDIDGGLAEYLIVPIRNIYVVDDIPDDDAVFIEPLAATLRALSLLPEGIGWKVAILGQGPLAYIAAQVFKTLGYDVTVIGKSWTRLNYFKELDVDLICLQEVSQEELIKKVRRMPQQGFDIVFEATGSPTGIKLAVDIVRPRGVILAKSTFSEEISLDYAKLVIKEVVVIGSRCGTFIEWRRAIELTRSRKLTLSKIITHRFSLADAPTAFEVAASKSGMKVVVNP